jgi:hypothetical protein
MNAEERRPLNLHPLTEALCKFRLKQGAIVFLSIAAIFLLAKVEVFSLVIIISPIFWGVGLSGRKA